MSRLARIRASGGSNQFRHDRKLVAALIGREMRFTERASLGWSMTTRSIKLGRPEAMRKLGLYISAGLF
jgi:hypothetical protein